MRLPTLILAAALPAPALGRSCRRRRTSVGKKFNSDPTAWRVVDGKLYLNFNAGVHRNWLEDVPGRISQADKTWPNIANKSPESLNAQ